MSGLCPICCVSWGVGAALLLLIATGTVASGKVSAKSCCDQVMRTTNVQDCKRASTADTTVRRATHRTKTTHLKCGHTESVQNIPNTPAYLQVTKLVITTTLVTQDNKSESYNSDQWDGGLL